MQSPVSEIVTTKLISLFLHFTRILNIQKLVGITGKINQ